MIYKYEETKYTISKKNGMGDVATLTDPSPLCHFLSPCLVTP